MGTDVELANRDDERPQDSPPQNGEAEQDYPTR